MGIDLSPLVWALGALIGAAAGMIVAAVMWAFAPLGGWVFALPLGGALIGGWLIMRSAR